MTVRTEGSDRAARLGLMMSAALFVFLYVRYRGMLVDDVFVALRYGANFAGGQGLVFDPAVAGPPCPDPLNAKLAAAATLLGWDPLLVLQLATAIGVLAYVWATAWLARAMIADAATPAMALSFVLPVPALAYWTAVPSDVVWLGTLIAAACAAAMRDMKVVGLRAYAVLFLLAALQRPVLTLPFLACALAMPRGDSPRGSRRSSEIGVLLGAVAIYLIARWAIYGEALLPGIVDPARRPEEFARMAGAARSWLATQPLLAATLLLWPVFRLWPGSPDWAQARARLNVVHWVAIAALAAALFAAREEPYPATLVWVTPLLAVLMSGGIGSMRFASGVATLLLVLHAGWGLVIAQKFERQLVTTDQRVRDGIVAGRWIRETLPEGETIATDIPGVIGFTSRRRTLGLSDGLSGRTTLPSMPTPRDEAEAALQQQPRFVVLSLALHSDDPETRPGEVLEDNFIFRFFYAVKKAPLTDQPNRVVTYFELEPREQPLWSNAWAARDADIDPFLDEAVKLWTREPIAPIDAALRADLERLNEAGLAASEAKDFDQALALFEEARRKAPDGIGVPALARNGGFVEVRRRDLHAAVPWFKDLMRMAPEDPMSRRHLRIVLLMPRRELFNTTGQPSPP